jgi:hypothetical protein
MLECGFSDETTLVSVPDVPTVTAHTVQLLQWIGERSRSYAQTLEAWPTSCPRLAVWEDALADDLIRIERGRVLLTAAGRELLTASTLAMPASAEI